MIPLRAHRMRRQRAPPAETARLRKTMEHISHRFGIAATTRSDGLLEVAGRAE